jgi:membrane-associated protease RseP (regulator of RpoE activity)
MRQALLLCVGCFVLMAGPVRAASDESRPIKVPFDLLATKHIVIQVKINGKGPYRMIFDTGAPISLVNSRVARESGIVTKDTRKPLFSLFGMVDETTQIKKLAIGGLKAEKVPVIVMDHPTVELISKILGPVEGIIGFPFFSRYRMTLDYQAKTMTFVPNGYEPGDTLQKLVNALMSEDNGPRRLAPAGLWGMVVSRKSGDKDDGVVIDKVLAGSAAARAGLREGDRLLVLDDRWTESVADCFEAASYVRAGTAVTVKIKRNGQGKQLTVTPQPGL